MKKKLILILILVLAPLIAGCSQTKQNNQDVMSLEAAKTKADSFVNEFLIEDQQQRAEISEITEEEGLYRLTVKVGSQEVQSYMTKNGKKFFASAMDMDNPGATNGSAPQAGEQPQMSAHEQAQSLISQSRDLLRQYGENLNEQDKAEFNTKIDELESLAESSETAPENLQAKMQEVQLAGQPLVEIIMEQQEQEQGNTIQIE